MAKTRVIFGCGHEGQLGYDPEWRETAAGARRFAKHRPCPECFSSPREIIPIREIIQQAKENAQ